MVASAPRCRLAPSRSPRPASRLSPSLSGAGAMKKARAGVSHRGKSGSKFQFDITLHDVSGLKAGNTYFVKWTRGAKVASTKTATAEGAAATRGTRWEGDKLSLLVTLFRPPDAAAGFDAKDAKLALVAVNPAKRGAEKTVAKVHFNLAEYAGVPSATATTRLTLSERVGVRMTVACKFLKVSSGPGADASYAPSGMSGLSGVTGLGGGSSSEEGVDDDFADLAVDDVPEPAPLRSPGRVSREGSAGAGGSGSVAASGRGGGASSLVVRQSSGSKEVPHRQPSAGSHGGSSGGVAAAAPSGKDADHLRATLAAAVAERTRLTAALAAAAGEEEEVATQRRRLVALRAKVTDANDSRAALQQRMEDIRRTSTEQAASVDDARRRLAAAQAAAKSPSYTPAAASPAPLVPGDTAGAVRAERERADALAASLAAKEVKIGAHATHAGKMKDTYTQLTGMYDRTQAENARLKAKVEAAKGAAVGAASGLGEAERAAEEAARKAEAMEAKLATARKDVAARTAEAAALREAVADKQAAVAAAHREADAAKSAADGEPLPSSTANPVAGAASAAAAAGAATLRRLEADVQTLKAEAAALRKASAKASKERQRALDAAAAGKRAARDTEVAASERRAAAAARKTTLVQLGRRVEELQAAATLAAVRGGVGDGDPPVGSGELSDVPLARLGSMNVEGVIADLVSTKLQLAETEDLRLAAQHKAKQQRRQERLIQERLAKHASRLEVKLGEARAELEAVQKQQLKLDIPVGGGAGGDAATPVPGGGRATSAKAAGSGGGTPARRNFFGFALGGGGTPASTPVAGASAGGGEEVLSPPSPNGSLSF